MYVLVFKTHFQFNLITGIICIFGPLPIKTSGIFDKKKCSKDWETSKIFIFKQNISENKNFYTSYLAHFKQIEPAQKIGFSAFLLQVFK